MYRTSNFLWLTLLLLILLPTAAGRFILDLAGSLAIVILILPLLLGGLGFIGWRILQSKMVTCEVCGISSLNNTGTCPICGSAKTNKSVDKNESIPASSVTIDIQAENAEE